MKNIKANSLEKSTTKLIVLKNMKLTLDRLRHLDPSYKSTLTLCLDNQNLREVDILQECEQLQLISLRYNQIQSLIRPLQGWNNLWVIDL